jgi:hypothetical protein
MPGNRLPHWASWTLLFSPLVINPVVSLRVQSWFSSNKVCYLFRRHYRWGVYVAVGYSGKYR